MLGLDGPQAADSSAAHGPATVGVRLAEVEAGVGDRLDPRGDAVVHELVHAARILGGDVLTHIEAANLPAEAHRKGGHIEAGNRADPALPSQNRIPRRLDRAPHGGHDAEACHDDTTFAHTLPV